MCVYIVHQLSPRKKWYVCKTEYYSAIKTNAITPTAATWMQLKVSVLGEVSQKEKDKYCMMSFICRV